jgi:2-methylcitrate dehydratase
MRLPEPTVLPSPLPDVAHHAAWLALVDALANAFQALQHPACARLVGPVVTGATMTFGARVPGTTYQLDPAQAAFCTGTLFGWPLGEREPGAVSRPFLADTLGAVLVVADFLARRALAEAKSPPTVREVMAAALEAGGRQELARLRASTGRADSDGRWLGARIASAEITAAAFGGSAEQVAQAARWARVTGSTISVEAPPAWAAGLACSDGVRLGLLALREGQGVEPVDLEPGERATLVEQVNRAWQDAAGGEAVATAVRQRLDAAVTAHFPASQAARLTALLADRARLEALPINELVSLTVRN